MIGHAMSVCGGVGDALRERGVECRLFLLFGRVKVQEAWEAHKEVARIRLITLVSDL